MKVYLIEKTGEKPVITTNRTTAARIVKEWLNEEEVYEWLNVWDIETLIEHDSRTGERSAWYITSHRSVTCEVIEVIEG